MLTDTWKKHVQKMSTKITITVDKIITSNLIRAVETGHIISKHIKCNDHTIYISPYIQETGVMADGSAARTIYSLKKYIKNNNINKVSFIGTYKQYKELSDIQKFSIILEKIVSTIHKKKCNIIIVTHGGFLSTFVLNQKLVI